MTTRRRTRRKRNPYKNDLSGFIYGALIGAVGYYVIAKVSEQLAMGVTGSTALLLAPAAGGLFAGGTTGLLGAAAAEGVLYFLTKNQMTFQ